MHTLKGFPAGSAVQALQYRACPNNKLINKIIFIRLFFLQSVKSPFAKRT